MENTENVTEMASKKNSIFDNILGATMLLSGAYLLIDLFRNDIEYKMYYHCPNCKYPRLSWGTEFCPNCKIDLQWPKAEKESGPQGVK